MIYFAGKILGDNLKLDSKGNYYIFDDTSVVIFSKQQIAKLVRDLINHFTEEEET